MSKVNSEKMRICLLRYKFNRYGGGLGRYFVGLAEHLCKEHEVHVVTTDYEYEIPRLPDIIVHKIPLIVCEPMWVAPLAYGIQASKHVKKLRRKIGFDVIHASSWIYSYDVATVDSSPLGIVVAWGDVSSPLIKHPIQIVKHFSPIFLQLEKRNLEKNKKLISLTEKFKRDLITRYGIREEKIVVIPGGVDLQEFKRDEQKRLEMRQKYGIDRDEIVLMFAAHSFKTKGLRYIIEALPMTKNVKLFAIGGGNPETFRALAQERGVLDRVIFTGSVKEISDYYSASDIFIFPALFGPFGLVIMEAMASRLPVIVSENAGGAELITDGYDGLLLRDPTDSNAIAEKINLLCTDEKLRKRMGRNARKTAEKYSWDIIAKRVTEVYEEVVKKFSH